MLAATGFTPLLVNLESMTLKLNAGGGTKAVSHGKSRRPCIIFLHADKVTMESSSD